jgi:Domain of unknown function (DUF4424)/YARHG domain
MQLFLLRRLFYASELGGCRMGNRCNIIGVLAFLVFVVASQADANDSSAELATGGLIFTTSNEIEMSSEELYISMNQIRVQYQFINRSDRDVVTTIAFPMPDIPYDTDDFTFVIPTDNPQNILAFTTTINNRSITANAEQKAMLVGVDRTDTIRRFGIPVAPQPGEPLKNLSQDAKNQLRQLGLVKVEGDDIYPLWTLKTTYYWQQVFPAHQIVAIDHRYMPSVGGTVPLGFGDIAKVLQSEYYKRYCIDSSLLTELRPNVEWEQHYLEYILVTGANWSGSIKNFRLVVEKGSPDNLISFCGQGVHKISPTQFEMHVSDFVPTYNLSVLILTPRQPEPASVQNAPVNSNAPINLASLNCDKLWYQRNSIFREAGYCFHTPRGIRVLAMLDVRMMTSEMFHY